MLDLVEYHKQPCQLEAKNQEKSSSFEGDDNKKKSINDEFQLADQPEKGCCRTKGRGGWLRFYHDQLCRERPFTEHELEDYIKCISNGARYIGLYIRYAILHSLHISTLLVHMYVWMVIHFISGTIAF